MFYIEKTVEAVGHEKLKEKNVTKILVLKLRRQKKLFNLCSSKFYLTIPWKNVLIKD